jgi:hypothetical protein
MMTAMTATTAMTAMTTMVMTAMVLNLLVSTRQCCYSNYFWKWK